MRFHVRLRSLLPARLAEVLSQHSNLWMVQKSLGTVTFTFGLPKIESFTNSGAISIPNSGPATPYPSTITVTGATGLVGKVTVALKGLTHSFPDDLEILLVGPDGQQMLLMSDVGGSSRNKRDKFEFRRCRYSRCRMGQQLQMDSSVQRITNWAISSLRLRPVETTPLVCSFQRKCSKRRLVALCE